MSEAQSRPGTQHGDGDDDGDEDGCCCRLNVVIDVLVVAVVGWNKKL